MPGAERADRGRDQLDAAGQQIDHRRRVAAIGHVHQLDAGEPRELGGRQVRQRAHSGRAVAVGLRLGLGQRLEFLEGLGRHLGAHRDHLRRVADRGDRDQVLHGVERHRLLHERIDHQVAVEHEAERGAVGRGLGDHVHAERAGGAGAVLDHRLLAGAARDLLGQEPRAEIGNAAGGKAGDDSDRFARPVLRLGLAGNQCRDPDQGHGHQTRDHVLSSPPLSRLRELAAISNSTKKNASARAAPANPRTPPMAAPASE